VSAVETTTARLVERAATAQRLTQAASTRRSTRCPLHPECEVRPDPTPVKWRCDYGHTVPAADLDREYHAPLTETEVEQVLRAGAEAFVDHIRATTDMDAVKARLYAAMRERGGPR
jgi:hypothetical protein